MPACFKTSLLGHHISTEAFAAAGIVVLVDVISEKIIKQLSAYYETMVIDL